MKVIKIVPQTTYLLDMVKQRKMQKDIKIYTHPPIEITGQKDE